MQRLSRIQSFAIQTRNLKQPRSSVFPAMSLGERRKGLIREFVERGGLGERAWWERITKRSRWVGEELDVARPTIME